MIKEMENEMTKVPNQELMQPKAVASFCKAFMKDLQMKYENVQDLDKIVYA